ncbi:MAG: hypothetical protein OES84_01280, partial [Kiritimatiellaceae bacterium]|nr:hypothetical protein [Kiritimatiellaceae bacterium]
MNVPNPIARKPRIQGRIANLFAIACSITGLVLASATYLFSRTSDEDLLLYFIGSAIVLTTILSYMLGRFFGTHLEQDEYARNTEMHDHIQTMHELMKANEFLETETLDLKKHRTALLNIMEDADRYNQELKREVAERNRAEAEAALARNNMELVLHGGDLGYWDWDILNNVHTFNARFA